MLPIGGGGVTPGGERLFVSENYAGTERQSSSL